MAEAAVSNRVGAASENAAAQTRWVYSFGGGGADGDASMKNLLGGKGANLAEMSSLGLPVPPGFTITTEVAPERSRLGSSVRMRASTTEPSGASIDRTSVSNGS